ncbi:GlcG/HbpS family heme-binding protein [Thorsellia anophelis]|uniref:Uncharacterized conserved protein GlcG, DUF336 family n=1 Tax=Thorsellia anophelis DSM 18579 TaxID=1123402 RepID=A0A1I0DMX3_9GAMM|nr:heme-binding protein [Thorsellia anophelis]SET33887.1 Uncharacterized conserved protein GlcG, DUF336 family [Thorsellia anophelis DSM 18579]
MRFKILTFSALISFSLISPAKNFMEQKNITLSFAKELTTNVIESCSEAGYQVAVTVIDAGGNVKTIERMDKAGPHTITASQMKAFTALTTQSPSLLVMENASKNQGAQNLVNIPGLLLLGGGLPIIIGADIVGAVGVGGAPGGHLDHECASLALNKMMKSVES